jgi:hypothetical protein
MRETPNSGGDVADEVWKKENWVKIEDEDLASPGDANLVSSIVYKDENVTIHTPLIDLDVEHFYVKSSTEGHAHLCINTQIDHEAYGELLRALHKCGIIGKGILLQYERDGQTNLRLPGIKKGQEYAEDANGKSDPFNSGGVVSGKLNAGAISAQLAFPTVSPDAWTIVNPG